jgi:hypothetical protein
MPSRNAYAANTSVDTGRSKAEIERTLERFGATQSLFGRDDETGVHLVSFKRGQRGYRFYLPMPRIEDFLLTPSGKWERTEKQQREAWEQEHRRRWRSLANYIKAMLDAIDSGIIDFDTAMLPHLMLPGGRTMAETMRPQIDRALETGETPVLMLALPEGR